MTRDGDFKRIVRERMAKTGEAFSTARRHLEAKPAVGSLHGWHITGPGDGSPDFRLTDYEGGIDPGVTHEGNPCAFLRSVTAQPKSHAVVMQSVSAAKYQGQRIRFRAWVRAEEDGGAGALWMRVVPADRDTTLAHGRAVAGPGWKCAEIVLDVPTTALTIMLGLSQTGRGQAWMGDAAFGVVDESVPVTGWREPEEPANLRLRG